MHSNFVLKWYDLSTHEYPCFYYSLIAHFRGLCGIILGYAAPKGTHAGTRPCFPSNSGSEKRKQGRQRNGIGAILNRQGFPRSLGRNGTSLRVPARNLPV